MREKTPNYHINGLQAAAAAVGGKRVGKMQKSAAAALTATRRSWQWDRAAGTEAVSQAVRQPQNVFPICQTEIIFLL